MKTEEADSAAKLKALRKRLGLSQEAMARRFLVTLRTYQRWEKGFGMRERHLELARTWVQKRPR